MPTRCGRPIGAAYCSISASIPCRWMHACACPSPDVVERLRRCCGRRAFDPGSPAMGAILAASPHRVFMSRVGRVEVFQPIPPANGKSPEGPHTHVLPKLLRHGRTHSATEPIPEGWVPCAHFYPAHPMKDAFGAGRPYKSRYHSAFQDLMRRFGDGSACRPEEAHAGRGIGRQGPVGIPGAGRSVCARHHSDRLAPTAGAERSVARAGGLAGGSRPLAWRRRRC